MSEIINVLIVEDNVIDRIITERILQKEGYFQVTFSNTLKYAIETVEQNQFNIIVLDLDLPDSKGIETFEKIKSIKKSIPIVVLSGSNDKDMTLEILRKGGQDVINKKSLLRHSLVESVIFSIERHKAIHE